MINIRLSVRIVITNKDQPIQRRRRRSSRCFPAETLSMVTGTKEKGASEYAQQKKMIEQLLASAKGTRYMLMS